MGRLGKTFWLKPEIAKAFKIRCAELGVREYGVIELLMVKWLSKSDKFTTFDINEEIELWKSQQKK